jgi:putative transposase
MSWRGNCHEFKTVRASGSNNQGDRSKAQNAAAERFFQLLKRERIRRDTYLT